MQNCWPMLFQITHLPLKGTSFRKLTNITFAYLLSSPFYNISNKSLYKVPQFWLKLGPYCPFFSRYIFWENWPSLLCAYCVLSYSKISKNNLREEIIRHDCIILAQIGLGPVYQKGIYCKIWPTLHWSFISYHAT